MSAPTRPVLRYHGGKWRLAPWILRFFPPHRVYVEPYGGGASVLLRKDRSYAEIYNDIEGEIVNLFRVLRSDDAARLVELVRMTPFSRTEFEISYLQVDDPLEQARRTMVRAGMGFGSTGMCSDVKTGFRGSAMRTGTHPAMDWARQPENLWGIIERLRGIVIENRPAVKVITYHDSPETLFYCDPPYVAATRNWMRAKDAYRHEMSDDDHRELAAVLHQVRGMVLLSGYPCPMYDDELYPDWRRVTRRSLADGARERTEVLWINPAAARLLQPSLFGEPS